MRALLDVSVLIALFDSDHAFHDRAHGWWERNLHLGWASCPLTENGLVRILSQSTYGRKGTITTVTDMIARLRMFAQQTDHQFWPDDISLRDKSALKSDRIHSSRQITDVYLLSLAVRHSGRLATFDTRIPIGAVPSATPNHLCVV